MKNSFWLRSLKRACISRSRTPPELGRVQCESSYDGDSETGSCSGSSTSSGGGSSTSSISCSSPAESNAYAAAERELILVLKTLIFIDIYDIL